MLNVAAAADLPIDKGPVGVAARSAPARPGALGPGERGGRRMAPEGLFGGEGAGGRAATPEPPEQPIAKGVGANPAAGSAHGEEREAAGGGSTEHNLKPPKGGQAGATVGGE
jgi:hypothetical protein